MAQDPEAAEFIMYLTTLRPLYEVQSRTRAVSILMGKVRGDLLKMAVQNLKAQVGRAEGDELMVMVKEIQSLQNELFQMEREMRNLR